MADDIARRDPNRIPSLIGVDSSLFEDTTTVAVDPVTHEMLVKASLNQDVEIGAVEIKDATSDTRATVGANGLYVDVRASALPTGAATSDNQVLELAQLQTLNALVPSIYDYISLSYTGSNLTGVVFKTGGSGGTTVSTLTLGYSGSDLVSVTKS